MLEELESKSVFIRTISHEIRSPLSTVNLGIEMLIENISKHLDLPDDRNKIDLKDIDETLSDIKISVDVALNTLNDLLSLDKIKSNLMTIETTKVKISDFIVQSLRPFKVQAKAANIEIDYDMYDELSNNHSILVDTIKMEQVLRNFLSNALKFSPSKSIVTVTVNVLNSFTKSIIDGVEKIPGPNGVVRISVTDQGAGISKDNQKKLFGQYVQIDSNKLQNGKGSGLGLWLSKSIVDLHGGVIGVESLGEGQGSTFYIELPLHEPPVVTEIYLPNAKEIAMSRIVTSTKSVTPSIKPQKSLRFPQLTINILSPINSEISTLKTTSSKYYNLISSVSKGSMYFPSNFVNMPITKTISNPTNVIYNPNESPSSDLVGMPVSPDSMDYISTPKLTSLSISSNIDEVDTKVLSTPKKLNILIVDDVLIARKMVQKVLIEIYEVCGQAKDGLEAYEIIKSDLTFYDVILIDFYMPKLTGPESTALMREAGYVGVILGCTASVNTDDEDSFMKSGADGVILLFEAPENIDMMLCLKEIAAVYQAEPQDVAKIIIENLRHLDTAIVLSLVKARADFSPKGCAWVKSLNNAFGQIRWDNQLPWELKKNMTIVSFAESAAEGSNSQALGPITLRKLNSSTNKSNMLDINYNDLDSNGVSSSFTPLRPDSMIDNNKILVKLDTTNNETLDFINRNSYSNNNNTTISNKTNNSRSSNVISGSKDKMKSMIDKMNLQVDDFKADVNHKLAIVKDRVIGDNKIVNPFANTATTTVSSNNNNVSSSNASSSSNSSGHTSKLFDKETIKNIFTSPLAKLDNSSSSSNNNSTNNKKVIDKMTSIFKMKS
eukprot:gene17055-22565_t